MRCEKCGAMSEPDENFCGNCGAVLGHASGETKGSLNKVRPAEPESGDGDPARKRFLVIASAATAVVALAVVVGFFAINGNAGSTASGQSSQAESSEPSLSVKGEDVPGITGAEASSTLPTGGVNSKHYAVENVLDGDISTAWVEGALGSGVGERIVLSGDGVQSFSGFIISAGYQESDYLYSINARPKEIAVYGDGELICAVVLEDAGLKHQRVDFGRSVAAESITIEIISVYEGSKYEDCCISEVVVF